VLASAWKTKTKKLISFSGLQLTIHGVMALSGFLIVRALSKPEYAAYTIAASLQTLLSALTDCGIGSGLNAVGGRIWNDSARLRGLVRIALRLRTRLAVIAVPLVIVSAFYLLGKNGVPWTQTFGLTTGVLLTIFGAFMTAIYAAPLRLHARYTEVQKVDLLGACVRLALVALLAVIYLNALTAILVTAATLALQGALLCKRSEVLLSEDAREDESDRRSLISLMKKQAFATVFFAYQAQITIWIISLFGSREKVADVGALTRLAIVFTLIGSILTGIVAPTLARCESLGRLIRLFALTIVSYLAFSVTLLISSLVWPKEMLWVLGGQYQSLTAEVPWLVANAVTAGLSGVFYTLALARGWIWQAWLVPVLTILTQLSVTPFLDLNTVRGVLIFGWVSTLPTLMVSIYMDWRGIFMSWRGKQLAGVAS
jgi:hypothetical protein